MAPTEPARIPFTDPARQPSALRAWTETPPPCTNPETWPWFHPTSGGGYLTPKAKALCASCPVRAECEAFAREQQEPWGVWGGLTADERDDTNLEVAS